MESDERKEMLPEWNISVALERSYGRSSLASDLCQSQNILFLAASDQFVTSPALWLLHPRPWPSVLPPAYFSRLVHAPLAENRLCGRVKSVPHIIFRDWGHWLSGYAYRKSQGCTGELAQHNLHNPEALSSGERVISRVNKITGDGPVHADLCNRG